VGKILDFVAAAAVVCVVLGGWCMFSSDYLWVIVGKFRDFVVAAAVMCRV